MALNFTTDSTFTGRYDASDPAGYPYGAFRNFTSPSNGTPIALAKLWNDWHGFFQSLLSSGKVVPSGNPDKVGASDYFDALYSRYASAGFNARHPSASPSSGSNYGYSQLLYYKVVNTRDAGSSYRLSAALEYGAVSYYGTPNVGDKTVRMRESSFDVTGETMFTFRSFSLDVGIGYLLSYAPITKLELTGIPKTARIWKISVQARDEGVEAKAADMAFTVDYSTGTWPILDSAYALWKSNSMPSDEVLITVCYDPSSVD